MKNVIVLCEDKNHFSFLKKLLRERIGSGCRIEQVPFGTGSGEQHVIQNFSPYVKALRKKGHRSKSLVAVLDADTNTVEKEKANLLDKLGNEPLTESDKVLVVIPKRAIETWVLFLSGQSVDESIKYPKDQKNNDKIKNAAKKLAEHCQTNSLPKDAPPSLKVLCESDWRERLSE